MHVLPSLTFRYRTTRVSFSRQRSAQPLTDHLYTLTQTVVINTHFSPEVKPVLITCFCSLINIDSRGSVANARAGRISRGRTTTRSLLPGRRPQPSVPYCRRHRRRSQVSVRGINLLIQFLIFCNRRIAVKKQLS